MEALLSSGLEDEMAVVGRQWTNAAARVDSVQTSWETCKDPGVNSESVEWHSFWEPETEAVRFKQGRAFAAREPTP